jgi:hypothetical protein
MDLSRAEVSARATAAAAAMNEARTGPSAGRAAPNAPRITNPEAATASPHRTSAGRGFPLVGRALTIPSASPATTQETPIHSRSSRCIPWIRTEMGIAKITSVTSRGCTRTSGPNASASDCRPYDRSAKPIPAHHKGTRASESSSPGESAPSGRVRATRCWTTPPTANDTPAATAATMAMNTPGCSRSSGSALAAGRHRSWS